MKKLFSNIANTLMVLGAFALSACSPESYDGLDYNGLPQASDIDAVVTVDQETNQYTLTLNNKGVYPVWTIHTSDTRTDISTRNEYKGIITTAGTYPVEVRMGNRNGVSEGSKIIYIEIENTIVDYAPYIRRLTNGDTKTWQFANDLSGHLGCGESGTDGLNWWSAAPNDKAGCGMYENRFIFSQSDANDGGNYTYDPGTSGTIYVNTGISSLSPYTDSNPGDGNDYAAPANMQNTTFQFKSEGTDLYLEFPAGTLLGYIPNVEAYNSPKFKVNSITNDNVELTIDNGSIAWHYILGLEGDAPFSGFKYDSEFNLWKKANVTGPSFWYAPGWNQIADPTYTIDGSTITVTLPEATTDTWQAQMFFNSDINTHTGNKYDFSVVLNSTMDHPHVTVKLVDGTDDGIYYCQDAIALTAYQDYIYYFSGVDGIDISNMRLFFDFGGNQAGDVITISNVVFKNHADDDGTVVPSTDEEPAADVDWVSATSDANIWNGCSYDMFFYYAPGWNQIADPGFTDNGTSYTIDLPSATYDQWQAQVHFKTNVNTSAAKKYDFRLTLNSTTDIKNVTVKLTTNDSDEIFYFTDRVNLTAYDDIVLKEVNLDGIDVTGLKLVLDFGGCPDNTKVEVSNVILQEHVGE